MAEGLGRVLVGGKDRGAGFALGPRLAVTANHVFRECKDNPWCTSRPGARPSKWSGCSPTSTTTPPILWLVSDVGESLPTVRGGAGGKMAGGVAAARRERSASCTGRSSRPDDDPEAKGQRVEVVQLRSTSSSVISEGYSGSAVLDTMGRAALALLVEQKPLRMAVAWVKGSQRRMCCTRVPIGDVITACDLPVRTPGRFGSTAGCCRRAW